MSAPDREVAVHMSASTPQDLINVDVEKVMFYTDRPRVKVRACIEHIYITMSTNSFTSPFVCCTSDENECATNNGRCNHKCENTYGSYRCLCYLGYKLLQDARTCQGRH